jgi:excisionase family DNA binding protein
MNIPPTGPREAIKTPATLGHAGHGAGQGVVEPRATAGPRGRREDRTSSAPLLLTLRQAAGQLAVSYWTVRAWADAGKLKVVRLPGDGRLVRVERSELERLIAASR